MSTRKAVKKLLVEGECDKRVIPQLVEANGVAWGETRDEWIVEIEAIGSVDEILSPGELETQYKTPAIQSLGIMVDADSNPNARWTQIKTRLRAFVDNVPDELPETGLTFTTQDGIKIGVWMMPDNQSEGMLESFLSNLVDNSSQPLWNWAIEATNAAIDNGATFTPAHIDKARIHTFLAWSDPPGLQLHQAVMQRALAPRSISAQNFITWFRGLYDV